MSKKRIIVLGSSGSIGMQTLDVVRRHSDKLEVVGLAVYGSLDILQAQALEFDAAHLVIADESLAKSPRVEALRDHLEDHGKRRCASCRYASLLPSRPSPCRPSLSFGQEGLVELVTHTHADIVVNALVGAAGLRASLATLHAGKRLALANKESLVVGGDLIMPLVKSVVQDVQDTPTNSGGEDPGALVNGGSEDPGAFVNSDAVDSRTISVPRTTQATLLPIDSEHGAIYQCLLGERREEISRLWVTASGGPFFGMTTDELRSVTPERALAHPTWDMGRKISIDSSTLMNKGLEIIEAHHLFDMPYDRIEVLVQRQSAIHSMVEFSDGSVKAHLGTTDMRIPIQFALSYPDRWETPVPRLDFREIGTLDFAAPDARTFRCLELALQAGRAGGTLPCVMNAANEIAVAAFLAGKCAYLQIPACIEAVMLSHVREEVVDLGQLIEVDVRAREQAKAFLS